MPDPDRVTFPGPFTHHEVAVYGWTVPFLRASLYGEDRVRLILDDRRGIDLSTQEAERVIPFLADAISVALGYGAHPRAGMDDLPPRLPHRSPRRIVEIAPLPDESA
jgi:hypothetical protein